MILNKSEADSSFRSSYRWPNCQSGASTLELSANQRLAVIASAKSRFDACFDFHSFDLLSNSNFRG
jgi:hypothetical protein